MSHVRVDGQDIPTAGLTLPPRGLREAWQFAGEVVAIDPVKAKPILVRKAKTIAADKERACLPQETQNHLLARAHILQRNERRNGSLTPAEQDEEAQLDAAWNWAEALRAALAAITADIEAGTITTVAAVENDPRWPDPLA